MKVLKYLVLDVAFSFWNGNASVSTFTDVSSTQVTEVYESLKKFENVAISTSTSNYNRRSLQTNLPQWYFEHIIFGEFLR